MKGNRETIARLVEIAVFVGLLIMVESADAWSWGAAFVIFAALAAVGWALSPWIQAGK